MNTKPFVRDYIARIRPKAQVELDSFRKEPTLRSATERAALAIKKNGKRYNHQRRLKKETLERARQELFTNLPAIEQAKDFDDLFTMIDTMLKPIKGIGELYIYDTSFRISAKRKLLPTKVYLHAGTREGARALGLDYKAVALDVFPLLSDFSPLEPHEIEDVLCIYKDKLKKANIRLNEDDMTRRSWCA